MLTGYPPIIILLTNELLYSVLEINFVSVSKYPVNFCGVRAVETFFCFELAKHVYHDQK